MSKSCLKQAGFNQVLNKLLLGLAYIDTEWDCAVPEQSMSLEVEFSPFWLDDYESSITKNGQLVHT